MHKYIYYLLFLFAFNIYGQCNGSKDLCNKRYNEVTKKWFKELKNIKIRNQESTTEINGPFQGNGYFLMHINSKFKNTLVFATEIKKIYCNELDGNEFPLVINDLEEGFKKAIIETSCFFVDKILGLKMKKRALLSPGIDNQLISDTNVVKDEKTEIELFIWSYKNTDATIQEDKDSTSNAMGVIENQSGFEY